MDQTVKAPILKREAKRAAPPADPQMPVAPGETAPPPPKKRRGFGSVVGTIIVLAILAGAGYWIYGKAMAPTIAPGRTGRSLAGATSVGIATAVNGTVHVYVNALGTVAPLATVTIQTQISGQLQQVAFKEGQIVKKGDFLAQVDSRPYQALKAQYEGQLARDQGLLAQAKADNARYQTLLQQNSIAKQQAEDQVFIVQQDEGTVRIDQALIDAQALNIAYCHIVSPVDGRIGLRMVDEGNYVQTSSSTGLAVITQLQPISVLFPIAEDDLDTIAPQVASGAKLPATLFDRANVKQLATGSVSTLDNQIDTTTGTVKMRAMFDNADNSLFPNQFVNVKLLVRTLDNAITVPSAAVQRGAPGAYVYLVGEGDKVNIRPITVGPTEGDTVAITKGLVAGDRVVVDGADRLRDGAPISIAAIDGKPTAPRGGQGGQRGAGTGTGTGTVPASGSPPAAGTAPADGTTPAGGPARDPSKRHKPADGPSGQAPAGQPPATQPAPNGQ